MMSSLPAYYEATLLERGTGFHFSADPPPELGRPQALLSDDPIVVISATLLQARAGNFEVFDHLLRLLRHNTNADVWNACSNLLAYAAPSSVLRKLLALFHEELYVARDGATQQSCCQILAASKLAWAVPVILDIFSLVKDRNRFGTMPFYLSLLLEMERGPIAEGPPPVIKQTAGEQPLDHLFDEDQIEYDELGYRNAVLGKFTELLPPEAESEARDIAILEGEHLSLTRVAENLLRRLAEKKDIEEVEVARMTLEAATGINCSAFYKPQGRLHPLTAAALVEDFLEGGKAAQYEDGVRYFFGHRIPD
jgi:hypothetical protein